MSEPSAPASAAPASVSARAESGSESFDPKLVGGIAGLVAGLLLGFLIGWLSFNSKDELEKLKRQNLELAQESHKKDSRIATLEGMMKTEQKVVGLDAAQCMAEAKKLVAESCEGKTKYVPKVVIRRERVAQPPVTVPQPPVRCTGGCGPIVVSPPPPVTPQVSLGKQLDRCIFRVKGEIKAETMLENGAVNCPIWRDQMLQKYHQNPNDKIWERVYPTQQPM